MRLFETRNYGINEIIKQYTRFPWYLPLPAHFEHGWASENVLQSDLATNKPLMLVFSKRHALAWKKKSRIPIGIMGAPFIHYKNMHCIAQKKNAKGTVAFPRHSTYGLRSQFSIERYCKKLNKLPAEFHPVTICLFWLDCIEKETEIYRKHGFEVVSAGSKFSIGLDFVNRFYEILSNYKYATSNEVGSYTFYAIDLGLSFFTTGDKPSVKNVSEHIDINVGKTALIDDYKYGRIASGLFDTGPVTNISAKQKKFVIEEMGLSDCLSRSQLRALLFRHNRSYRSFIRTILYLIESALLRFVLNGPWNKIVIRTRIKATDAIIAIYHMRGLIKDQ